jgi:Uncharacterised nucleotidyltransferase
MGREFPRPTELQRLLLRAALLPAPQARQSWSLWRAEGGDLGHIDEASLRLLPQLSVNLREAGVDDPDSAILKGAYRQAWYGNQATIARGRLALRALEDAGIPTLVLKGAALGLLYYASVGARPMEDLDVAVPRADAVRAVAVLADAGFRPAEGEVAENVVVPLSSCELADADGYRLDLHSSVLWQPEADEPFWAAAVPLRLGGVDALALCATDQLIHVCVHGARWDAVPPLRWIADSIRILDTAESRIDWDRLLALARHARLTLPLAAMLEYLRTEFGAPVPERVSATLRQVPVSVGDRLAHRTSARPPSLRRALGLPVLLWTRYSALARLGSERPSAAGFLAHLQRYWGLPDRRAAGARAAAWLPRQLLAGAERARASYTDRQAPRVLPARQQRAQRQPAGAHEQHAGERGTKPVADKRR